MMTFFTQDCIGPATARRAPSTAIEDAVWKLVHALVMWVRLLALRPVVEDAGCHLMLVGIVSWPGGRLRIGGGLFGALLTVPGGLGELRQCFGALAFLIAAFQRVYGGLQRVTFLPFGIGRALPDACDPYDSSSAFPPLFGPQPPVRRFRFRRAGFSLDKRGRGSSGNCGEACLPALKQELEPQCQATVIVDRPCRYWLARAPEFTRFTRRHR